MAYKIGMPCLKLNNVGKKSKHCGSFEYVAKEALRERCGRDADIDSQWTYLNMYGGYETAEELIAYSRRHVEELSDELRAQGKRGIRSDAVVMMAGIFKPPMEYWEEMTIEESEKIFQECLKKFAEIVGAENIKSWVVHYDELTPHMHVFWEPMTKDGRLCAKEVCNLKFFSKLNKEMPVYLREQGFDIADCVAYDAGLDKSEFLGELSQERKKSKKENGVDSRTFKYQQEQKVKELDKQIKEKQQIVDRLDDILDANLARVQKQADQIIADARKKAAGIVEEAESRKNNLDNEMAELILWVAEKKEEYDKMVAMYNFYDEQAKQLQKAYEEWQEKNKYKKKEWEDLDKKTKQKEYLLIQLGEAIGYIIWQIFDMLMSGISNVAHFVQEGEHAIAQYTLNKNKEDALSRLEQMPPEIREETERVIRMVCAAAGERYIDPYKR